MLAILGIIYIIGLIIAILLIPYSNLDIDIACAAIFLWPFSATVVIITILIGLIQFLYDVFFRKSQL